MKTRRKGGVAQRPVPSTKGVVARATLVFLEHGARAAFDFLGGSMRGELLIPKVFARAQYLERSAKRMTK